MSVSVVVLSLLVITALLAVGVVVASQARKTPRSPVRRNATAPVARRQGKPAKAATNPFRATSVRPGKRACRAARDLGPVRYLVEQGDVPHLPLVACDTPQRCGCTYAKHADRRTAYEERRYPGRSIRDQLGLPERRRGRGRRVGDR